MSTVFVSTPNIVHEANCPNKTKTLNEAESKSRVTVCGVKSCPRKLKKILVFVFSKFIFSLTKKFALSRDTVLSFVGGLSAVEKLFRWVQIVRVTFVSKLLVTFVFIACWAFEARHCPNLPNEIKKTKRKIKTTPQHEINILLATVGVKVGCDEVS